MNDIAPLPLLPEAPAIDGVPAWLAALRRSAVARYGQIGLPGPRTEAWKFTNLNALKALQPVPADEIRVVERPAELTSLDATEFHISDGGLSPVTGNTPPEGVEVADLGNPEAVPAWVSEILGTVAAIDQHPFAALNTAAFTGGVAIRVTRGTVVEKPILLMVDTQGGEATTIAHPRVLVVVEDGAVADLVEVHTGAGAHVSNIVTEIAVGGGARLGHYKWQAEGTEAFHLAMTAVRAGADATYDNFALSTGARLARNEIRGELAGEHVDYRVNGAYLAAGDQHLDTTTFIDHAVPECHSQEIYKGVLAGRSRGVFQGKILVRPHAQKTDGYQMNRALLLSRDAEIDSKPELEIYADDVKCSHGATVGELDDDQLFYLMARGIGRERARAILIGAYLDEAIATIEREPVREAFRAAVDGWMHANVAGIGDPDVGEEAAP